MRFGLEIPLIRSEWKQHNGAVLCSITLVTGFLLNLLWSVGVARSLCVCVWGGVGGGGDGGRMSTPLICHGVEHL